MPLLTPVTLVEPELPLVLLTSPPLPVKPDTD